MKKLNHSPGITPVIILLIVTLNSCADSNIETFDTSVYGRIINPKNDQEVQFNEHINKWRERGWHSYEITYDIFCDESLGCAIPHAKLNYPVILVVKNNKQIDTLNIDTRNPVKYPTPNGDFLYASEKYYETIEESFWHAARITLDPERYNIDGTTYTILYDDEHGFPSKISAERHGKIYAEYSWSNFKSLK